MKLWGGRFTKETNQLVHNFNASISFDQKFYKQDIQGSIAHVTMLAKQGILTEAEKSTIIDGLNSILEDIEAGSLVIDGTSEDIHSFVEANLIDRVGDAGKKLHTGRSRNDQVALDMRMFVREEMGGIDLKVMELLHSGTKVLNIASYPNFADTVLSRMLVDFHALMPEAEVNLRIGDREDIVRWLQNDEVDFAFGGELRLSGFRWTPLLADPELAVLPQDYPTEGMERFPMEEFKKHPFIMAEYWEDEMELLRAIEDSGIIIQISYNNRHGLKPCLCCSMMSAVPGYQFISAFRSRSGNGRR